MLNMISQKFHSWATGWRVFILFLADALMMGYIMPLAGGIMALAANNSVMPLDLMFFYTPQQAFEMMEKYGEAGRSIYLRIELTADIIYPVIYTLSSIPCSLACSFPGCSSAPSDQTVRCKSGM